MDSLKNNQNSLKIANKLFFEYCEEYREAKAKHDLKPTVENFGNLNYYERQCREIIEEIAILENAIFVQLSGGMTDGDDA